MNIDERLSKQRILLEQISTMLYSCRSGAIGSKQDANARGLTKAMLDLFPLVEIDPNLLQKKPPIGLRPKVINDQFRRVEVLDAMRRYADAGKSIPTAWVVELMDLQPVVEVPDES